MAKKYIALTVISLTVTPGVQKTATTPGKRPVVKEVQPGTVLVFDTDEEADELIALGAIRKAKPEETKDAEVQKLSELTPEQFEAAQASHAQHARELEEEAKRREQEINAQTGDDTKLGNQNTNKAPQPAKAAAKANAKAGKPAGSAKEAEAAAKDAAGDDKNGDTGAAGTGGNKDGQGTNEGANTTADANNNDAGTDDGGLV